MSCNCGISESMNVAADGIVDLMQDILDGKTREIKRSAIEEILESYGEEIIENLTTPGQCKDCLYAYGEAKQVSLRCRLNIREHIGDDKWRHPVTYPHDFCEDFLRKPECTVCEKDKTGQ